MREMDPEEDYISAEKQFQNQKRHENPQNRNASARWRKLGVFVRASLAIGVFIA